jgi:hypothetical protein
MLDRRQSCRAIDFPIRQKGLAPQPADTSFSTNACKRKSWQHGIRQGSQGAAHNHTSVSGVCYGSFMDVLTIPFIRVVETLTLAHEASLRSK